MEIGEIVRVRGIESVDEAVCYSNNPGCMVLSVRNNGCITDYITEAKRISFEGDFFMIDDPHLSIRTWTKGENQYSPFSESYERRDKILKEAGR